MHSKELSSKKIIFVGAKPDLDNKHAGGQTTASLGLIEYAQENSIELLIVDSAQESFPFPSFFTRLKRATKRAVKLLQLLIFHSVDGAIIFSSSGFSFYEKSMLVILCRLCGVRCLLFIRSGHFMSECKQSFFERKLYRFLLRLPNKLGAQGKNWIDFYSSFGIASDRIILVHNWLAPGRNPTNNIKTYSMDSHKPMVFLFIGWLVKKKGVLDLINAIANSEILRNSQVLIAGGGDLYDTLKEIANKNCLDNVKVLGWQSPSEIDEHLRKAHVFVLPTYAEGFPNALLEAISQGLPAIICPVGAVTESAKQNYNAELIEPGNVNSLRNAMEKFILNPDLIAKYSQGSLELFYKNHSRNKNCGKLFKYFE